MGLQEFLSAREIDKDTKDVTVAGIPFPFTVRAIGQAQNKEIKKACQKTWTDKKTGQRITETDVDLYNARLVSACCVSPNFKDADWQAQKGVRGEIDLIECVLKPGEFTDLVLAVQNICGFDTDINEEIDEAKN